MAAPTFFGVATNPADGGSLTEPQTGATLTPPGSMQTGDLVVVYLYNENGSAGDGLQINNTGGQTWTSDTTSGSYSYSGAAAGHRLYWCTFNGTWSANPTFDFPAKAGTRGCGMQMLVFRPDSTSKVWSIDTAPSWAGFSAPTTPFTVTITGLTPSNSDTVTLARWCSDDDNTWGSLSGTGWSKTGLGAQYANTGGSDLSTTYAYNLKGSPSATNNVSQNQATLGGDAGSTVIVSFYAAVATTPQACDASGTGTGSLTKSVSTTKAASGTGTADVSKAVTLGAFAASGTGTANLVAQTVYLQTCAASGTGSAALAENPVWAQTCAASGVGTGGISLQVNKIVAASGLGTGSVLKSVTLQPFAASGTGTANVSTLIVFLQACDAAATGTASLLKTVAKKIAAGVAAVANLSTVGGSGPSEPPASFEPEARTNLFNVMVKSDLIEFTRKIVMRYFQK